MDISKFRIPTLDRPNFRLWLDHIQSTTRPWYLGCNEGRYHCWIKSPNEGFVNKTVTTWYKCKCSWPGSLRHLKSHLEQEKHSRSWHYPSNCLQRDLAETPITANFKGSSRCLGNRMRKGGVGQRPTSSWSTWWKFKSPIQWIYCHKSKHFRTITTW